jgi:hypothetical protein
MKSHYAKLVRVALLYGSVCFLVFWGLSLIGSCLLPNRPKDDELTRQLRWVGIVVGEKIVGLFLLSITSFLASRAHHPTWKWGVATGIAAAAAYQLIAVLVYVVRFGVVAYQQYNALLYTLLWTVSLAWVFSYLAVRREYLHEKHAA